MSDKHHIFNLLKPEVGKAIYDLKWENFRVIQDQSIKNIIQSKNNIIISAPTASGKTEAAFLPTISESIPQINTSLKIVYISPLKALINDQILRVEKLCQYLSCKVTRWHEDALQSKKKQFLKNPSGILLITPESLESFLINRSFILYNLFKDVDFYIIDEVHSFVGGSRGEQLKSILNRIDNIITKKPRRILLSATMGNLENYKIWLDDNHSVLIKEDESANGIRGSVRFFENKDNKCYLNELINIIKQGKQLIFGNSKGSLELTCSKLKSRDKEYSNKIYIHHGSLSKDHREYVEHRLKTEPNISVFCTNTLELGIDIGNIDEVLLIDVPWSVSSFIQKIGRSGRKENSKIEFSFILHNPQVTSESHIRDGLRVELIQSIALVELMLDKWCEPGSFQTNSYSTFVHQVMSYLAQRRQVKLEDIWIEIAKKSFFKQVCHTDFDEIISHLILKNYICEESGGTLILGSEGDRLTESYNFYSTFFTPEEWSVCTKSKKLGTIPLQNVFREKDTILFAGKKWEISTIDYQDKVLQIIPSKDGKPPLFFGRGGVVHCQIHKKMKEVYESNQCYKYLTDESKKFLQLSRQTYEKLMKSDKFFPIFKGSGIYKLVSFVLRSQNIKFDELNAYNQMGFYLRHANRNEVDSLLKELDDKKINNLLEDIPLEQLHLEKYDYLLPKSILRKSFINSTFNIKNFLKYINSEPDFIS